MWHCRQRTFLRKLLVSIIQKYVRNQINPQKVSNKILTFFKKFFISHLALQSMKKSFRQFSNCPMLVQFLKNIKITLKMVTDQSKFLKTCQKYLEKLCIKCINSWLTSWINTFPYFNVPLEKVIAHSNVSLYWLKNGKVLLIVEYLLKLC